MSLINWDDVTGRYPALAKSRDATEMNSSYIAYALIELEERLSGGFTTPFSSNNLTAKDLAIDLVYTKLYRTTDIEKSKVLDDIVESRIRKLLSGDSQMRLSDGTTLTNVGDTVWSTTINYNPVFDTNPCETWEVSSSEQQSNIDARL